MKLIDSHTHLIARQYQSDRASVIEALPENGIMAVVECATEQKEFEPVKQLADRYRQVYAAYGVHPHSASSYGPKVKSQIKSFLSLEKAVAVGEIGLDYHYDFSPREVQRQVLEDQLLLARGLDFPVILHSRESTQDMLQILKKAKGVRGVMHCFSGSVETAKAVLDMGLYIGIGGALTFQNSVKNVEVAKYVPMDRVLVETDCPYMAPVPYRGKRNEPKYVWQVARKLAELKGLRLEDVANSTIENTRSLFGMDGLKINA